jgi:hypothetical protein
LAELLYIRNAIILGLVLVFFAYVLQKAWKKFHIRKNEMTRRIFQAFTAYGFSLLLIFTNTLTEYVFEINPSIPNPSFLPVMYLLQYGALVNIFLLIGNCFMFLFLLEVFIKDPKGLPRILFWVYFSAMIVLSIFFLADSYSVVNSDNQILQTIAFNREQQYISLILHSFFVFVPLIIMSLVLRHRMVKEPSADTPETLARLNAIIFLSVFFLSIFVSGVLDAKSTIEFSIFYYLTIIFEAISLFFAYKGFIKVKE